MSAVRNACDPCHRRKIRCTTSRNGGPCLHCKSRGLSCYFLPQYRSGRPRLNAPPPSSAVAIDHDALALTPPYTAVAGHGRGSDASERRPHQDFLVTPEHQQDYGLHDSDQTLKSPSITDDVLLELQQYSIFPDFAGSSLSHRSFPDISDHDSVFETTSTPLSAKIPITPWSTPSQNPTDGGTSTEFQSKAFQEDAFFNLLQQCLKLQRHLLAVEDLSAQVSDNGSTLPLCQRADMPDSQMQEMLEDVEANYKLILEICEKGVTLPKSPPGQAVSLPEKPPSQLLDPALISLITAVIFKALQICNIVLSGAGVRARSMADVLLYKRLDVNITLARIVMSKVEALALKRMLPWQELSNRTVHVERRFAEKREKLKSNAS
ncbi:hypothetical protein F5Y09DRAFT_357271 [Xylaria sp. FL1042]|nr:hypothetical protein F5Y09DRAFT_357271 [Xylaria sp. FL1042]